METALEGDLPAMRSAFAAFNRWLDDDWGFAYQDRIFAAAYISLSDVDHAIAELEWVLARGCRIVNLRAAPAPTETGNKSLGDPRHDPFWARVNEAGITVAFHSGDSGYGHILEHWGLDAEFEAFRYNALSHPALPVPYRRRVVIADRRTCLCPLPKPAHRNHRGRRQLGARALRPAREGV